MTIIKIMLLIMIIMKMLIIMIIIIRGDGVSQGRLVGVNRSGARALQDAGSNLAGCKKNSMSCFIWEFAYNFTNYNFKQALFVLLFFLDIVSYPSGKICFDDK